MLVRMPAIKQNDPKRIQVFMDAPPRRASALAVVSAGRDGENATWAIEVLKIEAAELGADAITHVKLNYSTGIFPSLRAQAVAVKYDQ
jgi:hypothetical protein